MGTEKRGAARRSRRQARMSACSPRSPARRPTASRSGRSSSTPTASATSPRSRPPSGSARAGGRPRAASRELVQECALWGFPAGILGGRLYHVITSWNEVPHTWWGPFAVWKGGLGIWGGIVARRARRSLARAPQRRRHGAACSTAPRPRSSSPRRSGESATTSTRSSSAARRACRGGSQIDAAHRPAGYLQATTFQPTFLYELLWNLALAGALVLLGRRRQIRPPGLFALYVAGYSAFRIFEETLRVDPAHHIFGVRLNLYVAVAVTLAGLAWFVRTQRGGAPGPAAAATG